MKSLLLFLFVSFCTIIQPDVEKVDSNVLIGTWKLDMTPENPNDENFAMMRIKKVKDNTLKGTFYREGVEIRDGRINIQTGTIYGALVSGDNSGDYNTSFYFKDGKLYGSTHALERGFLAVWVATKE
jgi:hypothetical protein